MKGDQQTYTAWAKWILSGEHTVIRGGPALVFPLMQYILTLNYNTADTLTITAENATLTTVFEETLRYALDHFVCGPRLLTGEFTLTNTIPPGCGLGFSAALCTVVGQWFESHYNHQDLLLTGFQLYRALEHKFHGHSSGVDIVGVSATTGMRYQVNHDPQHLLQTWQPYLYLSFIEKRYITRTAVEHVQALWQQQQGMAAQLQAQMIDSVELCQQGLGHCDIHQGLALLTKGMKLGQSCFTAWQLDPENEGDKLIDQGALAAKPTGSGGGGCFISLWPQKPPQSFKGIPLFDNHN